MMFKLNLHKEAHGCVWIETHNCIMYDICMCLCVCVCWNGTCNCTSFIFTIVFLCLFVFFINFIINFHVKCFTLLNKIITVVNNTRVQCITLSSALILLYDIISKSYIILVSRQKLVRCRVGFNSIKCIETR